MGHCVGIFILTNKGFSQWTPFSKSQKDLEKLLKEQFDMTVKLATDTNRNHPNTS
jgi:hypothetical protein